MSFQTLDQTRQSLTVDAALPVTVVPICRNSLLHLGLENLLSDTQFLVWHAPFDCPSKLPNLSGHGPVLFILHGNGQEDGAVDLITDLKDHSPTGKIVVVADRFEPDRVTAAWSAGADGFCLSSISREVLIRTLELIMLGETILPSALAFSIMDTVADHKARRSAGDLWGIDGADLRSKKLSSREAEILICLKEGASNKLIARKLNLSDATVKVHVKAILRKIGVSNRTQAALWASQHMSVDAKACEIHLS